MGIILHQWSEERLDALPAALVSGKSTSLIAAEIGETRNAVIAKVNRLRAKGCEWIPESFGKPTVTKDTLAGRPKYFVPKALKESVHNPLGNPKNVARRVEQRRAEKVVRGLPIFESEFRLPLVAAAPESLRIAFLDRKPMECSYFDSDGDNTVCGHPVTARDASYCGHHHKIVYGGSSSPKPHPNHASNRIGSGAIQAPITLSVPRKPAVLDVASVPHIGRWSRTISEIRLRAKISEDLTPHRAKQDIALALGLTYSALSKALHETPAPNGFVRLASHYGYRPMPGESGMYVAMAAAETEAA